MATMCRSEEFTELQGGFEKLNPGALHSGNVLQSVATGAMLFQAGDERILYRVERGAICHYVLWADGRHEVIEFAFPGDIIGLGHLDVHSTTGQAMVDTVVSVVSEEELKNALDHDDRLSFRMTAAVEREFDYLREQTVRHASITPTARVANLLLSLSGLNASEGRNGNVISDDLTAGYVAERLDMSIENLSAALLNLKIQGAVRDTPRGLEIVDLPTLHRLADAA